MNVPKEFRYLATCFSSGSDRDHATVEQWVGSTVKDCLLAEERKIVGQFLDELLAGSSTDEDLQRLWESLDSDYWVESGAGVRALLSMIRDASQQ